VLSLDNGTTNMQTQTSFQELLRNFKGLGTGGAFQSACKEMMKGLSEHIISQEEEISQQAGTAAGRESSSNKMVASFLALQLFCEVCPELGTEHIPTLVPCLKTSSKGGTKAEVKNAFHVVYYTAKILCGTIPLSKKLGPDVLKGLEATLIQLVIKATATAVVQASVECLSCCVKLTKNMPLITETLQKFYMYLKDEADGKHAGQDNKRLPWILRSLFVCGLFCQHFDFSSAQQKSAGSASDEQLAPDSIRDVVFVVQMHFASHHVESVQLKAYACLGYLCTRHPHYMVRSDVKELYSKVLKTDNVNLKAQVLENLKVMLISEEKKMQTAAEKTTAESIAKVGKKASALNTIVDMGGEDSGCSGIILSHLEGEIKSNVLSTSSKLRQACFIVMKLMLRQGLVHPMEHAAHLIALGADPIDELKVSANKQLDDLNTQCPDFVQQKAVEGMITTYKFKALLAKAKVAGAGVTGFKQGREAGDNSAELHHLYTLLKPKRTIRRCFVREIVALFGRSQEGVPRGQLVFVAGNMAHFPYSLNEETLYVVHEITLLTAVRGSQIQNAFRVLLGYNDALSEAEDEDSAADVADRIGDELTEDFVPACEPHDHGI